MTTTVPTWAQPVDQALEAAQHDADVSRFGVADRFDYEPECDREGEARFEAECEAERRAALTPFERDAEDRELAAWRAKDAAFRATASEDSPF